MANIYKILILLIFGFSTMGYAEKSEMYDIVPIPGVDLIREKQDIRIGEYDGSGIVDDVHSKYVVISDRLFNFGSNLIIQDLKGNQISSQLTSGMYIYYFLDKKGLITKIVVEK